MDHHLRTRCVHAGGAPDPHGALHPPLYGDTTFGFRDTASMSAVLDGTTDGSFYTRYGQNPTLRALEATLAALEGGGDALAFGSGMAAISATLLGHLGPGDHVIGVGDLYGGTHQLLTENLRAFGIEATALLDDRPDELARAFRPRTRVVLLESPTNPTLKVADIARVAELAHRHGALLVVDNTFATPINQRPLELGADLVVHSATKYLGGHSDLTGGLVVGGDQHLASIARWRTQLGQIMAPQVAYLLRRSLRTLAVRVQAHNEAGTHVADWLEQRPQVRRVHYPDRHRPALARAQMSGYGGVVSFVYDGDAAATTAMVDRLRLFAIAPSLGGVESLVTQPAVTSHRDLTPAERQQRGIVASLVRLSCGLEDVRDLTADLEQAL